MDSAAWSIILLPLAIFAIIQAATALAFPAFGLWRAFKAETTSQSGSWMALATIPFALLAGINIFILYTDFRRQSEIENFALADVKGQKFERIVVVGSIHPHNAVQLLDVVGAKEVLMFEGRRNEVESNGGKPSIFTFSTKPECSNFKRNIILYGRYESELRAAGFKPEDRNTSTGRVYAELFYSDYVKRNGRLPSTDGLDRKDCIVERKGPSMTWKEASENMPVLYEGFNTSLPKSNELRGDRYELKLNRSNQSDLLAYAETQLGGIDSQVSCFLLWVQCLSNPSEFRTAAKSPDIGIVAQQVFWGTATTRYVFDRDLDYYEIRAASRNSRNEQAPYCTTSEVLAGICMSGFIKDRRECLERPFIPGTSCYRENS